MYFENGFALDLPAGEAADHFLRTVPNVGLNPSFEAWHQGSPELATFFAKSPKGDAVEFARRAARSDTLAAVVDADGRKSVRAAALCNPNLGWTSEASEALAGLRDFELLRELRALNGCTVIYRLQMRVLSTEHPLVARVRSAAACELEASHSPLDTAMRDVLADSRDYDRVQMGLPDPRYQRMFSGDEFRDLLSSSMLSHHRRRLIGEVPTAESGLPFQQNLSDREIDEFLKDVEHPSHARSWEVLFGRRRPDLGHSRSYAHFLSDHVTWRSISHQSNFKVGVETLAEYGRIGQHAMAVWAYESLGDDISTLSLFCEMLPAWDDCVSQLFRTLKAAS